MRARLHAITFVHASPKDQKGGIVTYVLADTEESVRDGIDTTYNYGCWRDKDGDGPVNVYDDDYNLTGTESYLTKMLRLRGSQNDEDASYEDAYYGVTHYGWTEPVEVSDSDAEVLLRLGVAQDWRQS